MEPICPVCHVAVRPTDFYCYNCGKNLHEKPLSSATEYLYYAGSVFLPPLGLWWGYALYKRGDDRSKRIGLICAVLTVVVTIVVSVWTMNLFRGINSQVNQQLNGLQGF